MLLLGVVAVFLPGLRDLDREPGAETSRSATRPQS
jgi:hypothetical protein